ncbi:hypothetical protein TW95_gp0952 [Pandoravirus inopinatum]|uniref:Uncharacterized protein n=1 Tax=Pandoravirus inopinatum TaxID=1605721 RepID=A0A0B5J9Z8_9VIRU|nr:hypothetical protein TW95_gp0952 [Pandoravirus inopinatum]AJF97686.1 hypothetical protein [Pandoravirus inopinatum]
MQHDEKTSEIDTTTIDLTGESLRPLPMPMIDQVLSVRRDAAQRKKEQDRLIHIRLTLLLFDTIFSLLHPGVTSAMCMSHYRKKNFICRPPAAGVRSLSSTSHQDGRQRDWADLAMINTHESRMILVTRAGKKGGAAKETFFKKTVS